MGKRIIAQRRGRGTHTYKSPSHRYKAEVKHRHYDDLEKKGSIKGIITDLINCPGHSAPIATIKYENGDEGFIFAPVRIKVHDNIESGVNAQVKPGNTLPLKQIPTGTLVFNIEVAPADGGKLVRTSGTAARVVAHAKDKVMVQLPSKNQKAFLPDCRATIGTIAGAGRKDKPFVKAGKKMMAMRAKNKLYPRTSGVAMNAVDHPFGSGRGRQHTKVIVASRFAPPGKKVGKIRSKRTGKR